MIKYGFQGRIPETVILRVAEQVPRGKLQGYLWLDAKEASLGGLSVSPGAVRPIWARERGWGKICGTPGRVAVPGEPDFISVPCG